jgi:hypothetical protein
MMVPSQSYRRFELRADCVRRKQVYRSMSVAFDSGVKVSISNGKRWVPKIPIQIEWSVSNERAAWMSVFAMDQNAFYEEYVSKITMKYRNLPLLGIVRCL